MNMYLFFNIGIIYFVICNWFCYFNDWVYWIFIIEILVFINI